MNKIIPAVAATIIAGALALSGASVASAIDSTPITPGGTPSPSTSTSSVNTPAATLPSTIPLKASAASGQSSSAVVSVPLTVNPTSSSSPTAVPSASPAASPAVLPSKITVSPKPIAVEVPTLVLWEKPANTFGPQHVVATKSTADLNALDADALAGHCYQADLYHPSDTTGNLLEGGTLIAPGNPKEDLLPGGAGVAYKTWCVPVPVIPTPVTGVTGSSKTDCTAKTITTTTVMTTSNLFHLDGKVLVADKNIVTTKTTSRPATAVECPVIVTPPVVTPPTVTPPTPVTAAVVQSMPAHKALAFTGPTPLTDATQLALLLSGIIFLGAGIPMTIALRKRANREE